MAFDFKKEYREFYLPKDAPELVTIPRMNYVAVRGEGDTSPAGPTSRPWASSTGWPSPSR